MAGRQAQAIRSSGLHRTCSAVCAASSAQSSEAQATPDHLLHTCTLDSYSSLAAGKNLDREGDRSAIPCGSRLVADRQSNSGARAPMAPSGPVKAASSGHAITNFCVFLCVLRGGWGGEGAPRIRKQCLSFTRDSTLCPSMPVTAALQQLREVHD
jgi:hypothetical protein